MIFIIKSVDWFALKSKLIYYLIKNNNRLPVFSSTGFFCWKIKKPRYYMNTM